MNTTNPHPNQPEPRSKKWSLLILGAAVALLAGLTLYIATSLNRDADGDSPVASYGSAFGGSFEMLDQNGQVVTDKSLAGKPYAIFFGFTRCPDVCPITLSTLTKLRQQLGDDADKMNIVFVSVDPEHDTAEDIKRYLELFSTPVIGLTGSDQQIAKITKAFHVFYDKVPRDGGGYTIDHTASVILMNGQGEFVSTIAYQESPVTALQKLKRLIKS